MTVNEWKEDFKGYINALIMPRDDYNGIMEYIDEGAALLKEQEPIPCGEKIKAGDVMLDFYECGYCKNAIRKPWKYCPFCGKEVKWE